jgi:hypothetical protein
MRLIVFFDNFPGNITDLIVIERRVDKWGADLAILGFTYDRKSL